MSEIKSNKIKDTTRIRILTRLRDLDFRYFSLIIDKREIYDDDCYRSYGITKVMNGNNLVLSVRKMDEINFPSKKIVFLGVNDIRSNTRFVWTFFTARGYTFHWVYHLTIRHGESSTFSFADGHVEKHRWEDERTFEMAKRRSYNEVHKGSVDWLYMYHNYNRMYITYK